jgi:hypothetical protein
MTERAFFAGKGFPRFKGQGWFDSFTYPQVRLIHAMQYVLQDLRICRPHGDASRRSL